MKMNEQIIFTRMIAIFLWPMIIPIFAHADLSLEAETARILKQGQWDLSTAAEVQTASEGQEAALPIAIEYGITDRLELLVEPVPFTGIYPKHGKKARGLGDLEVTMTYLLSEEHDGLPALAMAGELKLPTARNDLIGSGKTDATFYVIGSKRYGDWDLHLDVGYTILGKPSGAKVQNTFTAALAAEYRLSEHLDLIGEILGTTSSVPANAGRALGNVGVSAEVSTEEYSGTAGFRYHVSSSLVLFSTLTYDNNNATLLRGGVTFRF